MKIYGSASLHGPQSINAPHAQRSSATGSSRAAANTGDRLEISDAAQLALSIGDIPEIRQDRVDQIRQQIADGSYDTEERMRAALDSLLDEIA